MTTFSLSSVARAFLLCIFAASFPMSDVAHGQLAVTQDPTEPGKAVFKRANCVGCHKWHGNGGGGYGGDALSLRKTELAREQIIETIGCGRPGTGMPFFLRGAYDSIKCYDSVRQDLGGQVPPEATSFLRPSEVEAVADYVLARIKGKGEPTYDDCISFFAEGSRVCNIYKADPAAPSDNRAREQ